jgi:hypothetical protein
MVGACGSVSVIGVGCGSLMTGIGGRAVMGCGL